MSWCAGRPLHRGARSGPNARQGLERTWTGNQNRKRDADHKPQSAKTFALSLDPEAWQTISWREGTNAQLSSRFARVRVRPAHRETLRAEPRCAEWLIIEWLEGEAQPSKSWLSTLPETIGLESLVDHATLRWRFERDDQDLKQDIGKQDIGLSHDHGRVWRGCHHHAALYNAALYNAALYHAALYHAALCIAALCIAAYAFLISERETIAPSRTSLQPQTPVACHVREPTTPRRCQ
jgi:SRSO17 transposase